MPNRLLSLLLAVAAALQLHALPQQPNILFITMDDMNRDSIGCYGSPVENISPHIDSLASEGMRFQHAFVNSPICTPSRNVIHTGRYPHVNGVRGFYSVVYPPETVPELLRGGGYFTAILQKVPDSTPTNDFPRYWDFYKTFPKEKIRTPAAYGEEFEKIIKASKKQNKPFYANINVIDPHLPFYRGPATYDGVWDMTPPSHAYDAGDAPVPGFLPQSSKFDQEIADYYSSVRRGDDCVGAVLEMLRKHNLAKDTIIIFLSDHGMSFPFAKSTLYPAGVRTPWIVVWPGVSEPNSLDTDHMISTIDFLPTVLDIAGVEHPENLPGRSLVPLIHGKKEAGRDYVYVELNENPNADIFPARGIYTRDFVYIFNPWSNGTREAIMESRYYRSYATFSQLAEIDPDVRERFEFLNYRTVEELYNYSTDPHALNNLIDNPNYEEILQHLTTKLEEQMIRTDDYMLPAFRVRNDPQALEEWMAMEDAKALERSKETEWKRWKNRSGPTKNRSKYHDPASDR